MSVDCSTLDLFDFIDQACNRACVLDFQDPLVREQSDERHATGRSWFTRGSHDFERRDELNQRHTADFAAESGKSHRS